MQVIVVRRTSSRHSADAAVCVKIDGELVNCRGACYGHTRGNGQRGQTDQNKHYFTRLATDDEVKAFVDAGLAERPEPVINGRGCGHNGGARQRSPHKLPAPLLQQRA